MSDEVTPDLLLEAYANGWFPMGRTRNDPELHWFSPDPRTILPLTDFHLPRRLARRVRQKPYTVRVDTVFSEVMQACAAPRYALQMKDETEAEANESWINGSIRALYEALSRQGHAHCVECWQQQSDADATLVGGLYGVSLGGAFFGESMFSLATDASKIALAYLVEILREAGYGLLDVQYRTEHLSQFGVVEISRHDYLERLESALRLSPNPSSSFSRVSSSVIRTSSSGFSVMRSPVSERSKMANNWAAPPDSK